jgi:putative transposase
MVLCVKYRKKLLYDYDKIEFIKIICSEIGKRYSIVFDAIGTDSDHVHVFVGAAPQYSPSKILTTIPFKLAQAQLNYKVVDKLNRNIHINDKSSSTIVE